MQHNTIVLRSLVKGKVGIPEKESYPICETVYDLGRFVASGQDGLRSLIEQ